MMYFFYITVAFYAILCIITIAGLVIPYKKNASSQYPAVSVLIVARNEEGRIGNTLNALQQLDLEGVDAEFIFVDDGSLDSTYALMQQFRTAYSVQLIQIQEKNPLLPGKKDGITRAVASARGEVIIMTDADCTMPTQWVKSMITCFDSNTVMLLGHVNYKIHDLHSIFANIEALCGSIFAFSWARFNFSPYCRGANLAFRKSAFIAANGYAGMPVMASGDDMFLLQKLRRFGYCKPVFNTDTHVTTELHSKIKAHVEQQKRKYAKNFRYEWPHQLLFLFGVLFHVGIVISLFLNTATILPFILYKIGIEFLIFIIGATRLHEYRYILLFPFFIALFPFEIILFSIWGTLRKYRWKSEEKIR